jgi:hypothetical protein
LVDFSQKASPKITEQKFATGLVCLLIFFLIDTLFVIQRLRLSCYRII